MTVPTNEEILAASEELSALNRIVTACTTSHRLHTVQERVLDEALAITAHRLFVGRDLRMRELKERLRVLEQMVSVP